MKIFKLLSIFLISFNLFAQNPDVLIFYSDMGMGHLSAARSIESDILANDSRQIIELKNIRDFEGRSSKGNFLSNFIGEKKKSLEEFGYWYIVKNYPDKFTDIFNGVMEEGNSLESLTQKEIAYDQDDVLSFLQEKKPKVVIATHYGSAEVLGVLRAKGLFTGDLAKTKIGWLHTDYIEGYFPRISLLVDKTFLPHEGLESVWARRNVPENRYTTTGMPLNKMVMEEDFDKEGFLESKSIDLTSSGKRRDLVTLASGGEGVGDFPVMVNSIAQAYKNAGEEVTLVAVTAKNKEWFKKLNGMKSQLKRSGMDLRVEGFVKQEDLIGYIKSSDGYITKAGGLSPTEAFALMAPSVILDVYGGHESENARFFEKLGMAEINHKKDADKIGPQMFNLIRDDEKKAKMLVEQKKFRDSLDISKVTDFALDSSSPLVKRDSMRGKLNGTTIYGNVIAQLEKLEKSAPGDIEILMAYALMDGRSIYPNPFGHMAIKVGERVFTINGEAKLEEGDDFFVEQSLAEYLYSNEERARAFFGDSYGESYMRDNLGLKISGIPMSRIVKMVEETRKIKEEWFAGKACYNRDKSNCVDFVERVIKAGGYNADNFGIKRSINTPRDLYDRHLDFFMKDPSLRVEVVKYQKLEDSQARSEDTNKVYLKSRFPVTIYRPLDATDRILHADKEAWQEKQVTKRMASYPGQVIFENLNGSDVDAEKSLWLEEYRRDKERKSELKVVESSYVEQGNTDFLRMSFQSFKEGTIDDETFGVFLSEFEEKEKKRQALVDNYSQSQLRYFLDKVHTFMTRALDNAHMHINEDARKRLLSELTKLAPLREKYLELESLYGTAKDFLRLKAYKKYFVEARKIAVELRSELKKFNSSKDEFDEKSRQFSLTLDAPIKGLGDIISGTFNTLSWTTNLFTIPFNLLSSSRGYGETPVSEEFSSIGRKLARQKGYSVEIDGNIDLSGPRSREVTLVTPTHFEPEQDMFLSGSLMEGNDHLVFAAIDQIIPGTIGDTIAGKPEIIAVGHGRPDPIEKTLAQLRKGVSHNILIYPQGAQGITSELLPIRAKFETGLVQRLIDAGYQVKIVPVTYLSNPRFLNNTEVDENKSLRAKVSPVFEPALVKKLVERNLLNLAIRAQWLDELPTDDKQFFGHLRVSEFDKRVKSFVPVTKGLRKQHIRVLESCQDLVRNPTKDLFFAM